MLCPWSHSCTEARRHPVKLHANHVSVDESGGGYFQVSFDSEVPSQDGDALDLSAPTRPYLLIQRQFEDDDHDDDDDVCYIETHDHDTYSGHYRLRLIEFTPTHLAFEIARRDHKQIEVTYKLGGKQFRQVQRIVQIIFGVQG
jgi:hypothetical protein